MVEGSVLGVATTPGFSMQTISQENFSFPFSEQSPAGLLWSESKRKFPFQFQDHIGWGGFGKSTAEYLSVLIPTLKANSNFSDIRLQYQSISEKCGARVSGLDMAIQYFGRILHFDQESQVYQSLGWNFSDFEFFIVSTGLKVKTHEHLATLNLDQIRHFPRISNPIVELYFKKNGEDFCRGLNEWSDFLVREQFIQKESLELSLNLRKSPEILSAKPCGAMGADVIFVMCRTENFSHVKHKISELNLNICATTQDIAMGILDQLSQVQGSAYVD